MSIYTVLLIVAGAFLALATLVTYTELSTAYKFLGSEGFVEADEDVDIGVDEDTE